MQDYILDANTFITPFKNYYPFDFALTFWQQVEPIIIKTEIKILDVVYKEMIHIDNELATWLKGISDLKQVTIRDEEILKHYGEVLEYVQKCGYYNQAALSNWSNKNIADAWIIAAAMKYKAIIITFEQSVGVLSIKNKTSKVKIPDVAKSFGIECKNLYDFIRAMKIIL